MKASITILLLLMWMARIAGAQASPGSLYIVGSRLADLARDFRASQPGDIVTIVVSDKASALAKGATATSRKSSAKANVTSLAGAAPSRLASLVSLGGEQSLDGGGQTSRDMALSTTLTARVIDVGQAGILEVEGTKDISVNSERQTITLRGYLRPEDLTVQNTIRSDQIAQLAVHVNGKGVVGDSVRRPMFLYRLLLGLLPL